MSTEAFNPGTAAPAAQNNQSNESAETETQATSAEASESAETESSDETGLETKGQDKKTEEKKTEEVKKSSKRKLKLKVDGKEMEEEVDFDDDEYLTRQLQLAKAAQKRMNEYSQLEKEVAHFLKELKANPKKVLSDPDIGIDIKQLAASIIEEEIANAQKTPEQVEREKLEAELQKIKSEREQEKEQARQKEFERLQQQEFERYDMLMSKALEKSDLPKSPYIVKKMADYMLLGLQNNIDVSPEDVVPLVREEMVNDLKEMFAVMPEEVIENIIGKETINKLRKKKVAAVKAGAPALPNKQVLDTATKEETKKDSGKKVTYKDFFNF